MSISSDETYRNVLSSWKGESTPLKVTVESAGIVVSGRASLSELDEDGLKLEAPRLFSVSVAFESAGALISSVVPADDPQSIAVRIVSGMVKCLLLGANPLI
jgi:hypothetical protein